jgi:hypothetical protein
MNAIIFIAAGFVFGTWFGILVQIALQSFKKTIDEIRDEDQ